MTRKGEQRRAVGADRRSRGARRGRSAARFVLGALLVGAGGCGRRPGTGRGAEASPRPAGAAAVDTALEAADRYLNTGAYAKAEVILDRLIERAPREERAHELMGQVLSLQAAEAERGGDREAAQQDRRAAHRQYQRAVELRPDSAGLRQSAGVIAMSAGESEAALECFQAAAALDPLNPQHPLYAAQILIQRRSFDRARAAVARVLALDSEEPLAHASLAMIEIEEGHWEAALAHITDARALAPGDLRFRVLEARIHRRGGEPRRAVALLAGLTGPAARDRGATYELASGYAALGRHLEAAAVWERRFRDAPDAVRAAADAARAGLARLRGGDRDAARRWLATARAAAGNAPETRALEAALR